MCLRVATIAILVAALFLPSESEKTYANAQVALTNAQRAIQPYLDRLPAEAMKEFNDVVMDDKLTLKEARAKQLEWVKKYGLMVSFNNSTPALLFYHKYLEDA